MDALTLDAAAQFADISFLLDLTAMACLLLFVGAWVGFRLNREDAK